MENIGGDDNCQMPGTISLYEKDTNFLFVVIR